jgi:hypothetical protein
MMRSSSTPASPIEGEGVRCPCVTDLLSPVAREAARRRSTMDVPSPLAGEGQGGGKPLSRPRTEAQPWRLQSLVRCARTPPTRSDGSGPNCADDNSKDGASGDRLRSDPMSSTSRVSQRGWSSRLMGASTAGGPDMMRREAPGSRPTASRCSASGTTKFMAISMGSWRGSGGRCRVERRVDPHPDPPPRGRRGFVPCPATPARGEGVRSVPSSPRGGRGFVPCPATPARGEGVRSVPSDPAQQSLRDLCTDAVRLQPGRARVTGATCPGTFGSSTSAAPLRQRRARSRWDQSDRSHPLSGQHRLEVQQRPLCIRQKRAKPRGDQSDRPVCFRGGIDWRQTSGGVAAFPPPLRGRVRVGVHRA